MHFTTTMSVSLVLFLVGLECVVLMSARELVKSLRENVTLTVVLEDEATEDEVARFQESTAVRPESAYRPHLPPQNTPALHSACANGRN